jgi:outer membrane cobalamin receptor
LEPVKVNSYETGLRGNFDFIEYEISGYYMTKTDDILSFRNPVTGFTESLNAGETSHKGIETGLGIDVYNGISVNAAYSYSFHKYEEWIISGVASYTGNEMETAPREVGNLRINYEADFGYFSLELVRLGDYWMDPANTVKYPEHNLLNFRFNIPVFNTFELYGSLFNLTDKRFAESASYTPQRGEEFAPGMPRSFNIGFTYKLN